MNRRNAGVEKFNKEEKTYEAKINEYIKEVFIPKFAKDIDIKGIMMEKNNLRRTVYFLQRNFWIEIDFLASNDGLEVASGYRAFEMGKENFYQTLVYYSTLEESFNVLTTEITKYKLKKIFIKEN